MTAVTPWDRSRIPSPPSLLQVFLLALGLAGNFEKVAYTGKRSLICVAYSSNFGVIIAFTIMVSIDVRAETLTEWQKAEKAIVRLSPNAFPSIPKMIRDELARRKCSIPQPYGAKGLINIIQGELKEKGQKDWAALCSVSGRSSILIFWNGSINDIREINTSSDESWLQRLGNGNIGYSRWIQIAEPSMITTYLLNQYVPDFQVSHDGLEDLFAEKASTVYYYRNDK